MKIEIASEIRTSCPQLKLAIIECTVQNSETSSGLWTEMEAEMQLIQNQFTIEGINKRPAIAATRAAYKLFGKDPNRYRPSAEALCRRIVREIDIYKVSTLVDIINLVSIRSGFSIGGFDLEKIQGDLLLRVGASGDVFEAIGRGQLNVEGLPLYCDQTGGIGTPTSDNERTKITAETTRLLMIINAYGSESGLKDATDHALELLKNYAELKDFTLTLLD